MSGYKALYAVPKQSFDTFLKYRMGTFPNLKSLYVDQLNFNEAKKLQAVHQNSSNEKQKSLSLCHDNPLTQGQINFYQDELPTAANFSFCPSSKLTRQKRSPVLILFPSPRTPPLALPGLWKPHQSKKRA